MLNLIRDPRSETIPGRVNEFLQSLPGPAAIHLTGRDTSRTRVLVTLSHGNEPSGLEAVMIVETGDVTCIEFIPLNTGRLRGSWASSAPASLLCSP